MTATAQRLDLEEAERVEILVVDDRPSNRESLAHLLERPDYHIVQVSSGPEALREVLRRDFAVILLDVAMPGMDGFETAALIKQRERSARVPILFVTASVYDLDHIFRGYSVGAVDYLQKPVDPHTVRTKVAVFVELFRQARQIERQAERLRVAERREQDLLRQRAEDALRDSEAQYQAIFEQAPIGIGHADVEARWQRVNPALCGMFGALPEHLVGRPLSEFVHPDDAAVVAESFAQLASGASNGHGGEHRFVRLDGTTFHGHLTFSALSGTRRHIVVIDDITEIRETAAELRAAVRARDEFMSIASHELRTPLTPLRLQIDALGRALNRVDLGGTPVAKRLRVLDHSAERLHRLIESLLDVSRIGEGRLTLELEMVDLGEVAREVVDRMTALAQHAGSTITLEAAGDCHGLWDRMRLDQLVTNLVSNAIKYGDGGAIVVQLAGEAERVRLTVRDHGIGIDPAEHERIFGRFERAGSSRHYGGLGLGLWIVRQVVDAHGGYVEVRSTPRQGSEFEAVLPRSPS